MFNIDFDYIASPKQLNLLLIRLEELAATEGPLGLDTETTGLNCFADRIRLIQIASEDYCLVIDCDQWRPTPGGRIDWSLPGAAELKSLLTRDASHRIWILQNAAFDLGFLHHEEIVLNGYLVDTMIGSKIVNNGTGAKNDLASICYRYLKIELPKELQKSNFSGELTKEQLEYAARDAIVLTKLYKPIARKLKNSTIFSGTGFTLFTVFDLEMQCLRAVARMSSTGFKFDLPRARNLLSEITAAVETSKLEFLEMLDEAILAAGGGDELRLPRMEDGSYNTREKTTGSVRLGTKVFAGFNPRSPQQLIKAFLAAGILLPPNAKGVETLDQNLLSFIRGDFPLIDKYLTFKNIVTQQSHIEKLIDATEIDGRIYGSYRQMGTDTGRLSAANPNLQQVPRSGEFRACFIPENGYSLVVADFSQVELRVAADIAQETKMIDAYKEEKDLHTSTAALLAGIAYEEVTKAQRQVAKAANFGLLYGAGAKTLRKVASVGYGLDLPISECETIVKNFRAAYPQLYQWQQKQGQDTTEAVFTLYGRRRILTEFSDKYTTRLNSTVQGTAGDIAKIAMAILWDKIISNPQNEARLIASVHDELVLEVRSEFIEKWKTLLKDAMEEAGSVIITSLPIVAEVSSGCNWAAAK